MKKIKELSIFFPFWNEEENIKQVVENAVAVASQVSHIWEIILVDDGSNDKTLEIANGLSKRDKRISVISHKPNRGYGAALSAGFISAQYDTIVFTDGDLQ